MSKKREYDGEYKVQEVKLAKNLGSAKAVAEELQIPVNTLYGWIQKVKTAELDIGCGERSPEEALNIAKENQQLKKRIKALEKENRRLSEMMNFWRMQQLFSLPAVRSPERAAIELYCISNRWRQKRRKNPLLLQSSGGQQTGFL